MTSITPTMATPAPLPACGPTQPTVPAPAQAPCPGSLPVQLPSSPSPAGGVVDHGGNYIPFPAGGAHR